MADPLIASKEELLSLIRQGYSPDFLFFWGHRPPPDGSIGKKSLSQWYSAPFVVEGIHYPTAEHYMMAEKARLFGDTQTCERILRAADPEEAKELGRIVKGFDDEVWNRHRLDIVVRGNEAKFRQNEKLGTFLLETAGKVLVEASPHDTVWGIGLKAEDPRAADPTMWRGLNLLGFALMVVRSKLLLPDDSRGSRPAFSTEI